MKKLVRISRIDAIVNVENGGIVLASPDGIPSYFSAHVLHPAADKPPAPDVPSIPDVPLDPLVPEATV